MMCFIGRSFSGRQGEGARRCGNGDVKSCRGDDVIGVGFIVTMISFLFY